MLSLRIILFKPAERKAYKRVLGRLHRITLRTDKNLEKLLDKALSKFPLYDASHELNVSRGEQAIFVNYRTVKGKSHLGTTHLDLQIEGKTCFIVSIELEEQHRGKGIGRKLYESAETFGKMSGCFRMQTTPSGTTHTGKTRMDYVKNLGYRQVNDLEAVKEL